MKAGLWNSALPPCRMLAQCLNVFLTQAHVTLVDGHGDDALPNTQSKRAHYWAWARVEAEGKEKKKHMDHFKTGERQFRMLGCRCVSFICYYIFPVTSLQSENKDLSGPEESSTFALMHQRIWGLKRCRF